ncbi:hypothetical protein A3H03_00540 [Candidatus Kuenenbacteria bacterium RIFCSPLOWO2_12_FULL_42_13]|uniref:Rod shape-determining protein MreD n=3 Tax=Candidatus Kueneniibacteriota TaxID=1752740 RepID=A0A0G0YUU3_9BACT|nr:MAG: hypothetical protein UV02_C0042G0005 [Candidatus Kuenenbacteria bacterium GW2011_GWA2_42_15]OGG89597.1 MAG: hypothetical protein A3C68_00290 [Candidatus Kuenenbacteria bacterium RIFCSPHIGHO2_02_FULL_42_29]OGG90974.1 MAG: hypothetical protein A3H55_02140 [Candidatus Kuenenbacteria bacterium RIFCSPLOWO2_02_FULL_42_16]OGG91261.1 MAG: hypothetical protein A3H03_00540 [Candidatus Kuenenbacteria bacterium RIFCSPLOWO2_12_FULL_42_13]
MARFIYLLLLIILIIVFYLGFLPAIVPRFSFFINLPLIFLSLVAFFSTLELALFSAAILGLFLDLYSPWFFGFHLLTFLSVMVIIKFFLSNFFQNKNLLSLIATVILPIFIYQIFYLVRLFISFDSIGTLSHWLFFLGQIGGHMLIIFFLFVLPTPLNKKFKHLTVS